MCRIISWEKTCIRYVFFVGISSQKQTTGFPSFLDHLFCQVALRQMMLGSGTNWKSNLINKWQLKRLESKQVTLCGRVKPWKCWCPFLWRPGPNQVLIELSLPGILSQGLYHMDDCLIGWGSQPWHVLVAWSIGFWQAWGGGKSTSLKQILREHQEDYLATQYP